MADGVKFDQYPIETQLVFNASIARGSHTTWTWDFGNDIIEVGGREYQLIPQVPVRHHTNTI